MSPVAPAGFYQDPLNANAVRYWDGLQWTQPPYTPPFLVPLPVPTDRFDVRDGRQYVGFLRAVGLGFRQYAKFSGRASRSEYWWWTLATFVGMVGAAALPIANGIYFFIRGDKICDPHYGGINTVCTPHTYFWVATAVSIAFGVVLIAMVVPSLAVSVRRLHDSSLSGYLMLLLLAFVAPGIGLVAPGAIFVMCARPTKPMANQYGYPPTKGRPRRADVSALSTV